MLDKGYTNPRHAGKVRHSNMKYTTLEQLTRALEHSQRDMLVVVLHGNERAALWPPGHPEGWCEDSPRVFRVPAGMNGETREFLREKLNAMDAWAITGDVKKTAHEDWLDFAVQRDLNLEPVESQRHQIWRGLTEIGPCTANELADHLKKDARNIAKALYLQKHRGACKTLPAAPGENARYEAATEPPYEAAGGKARAVNGYTEHEAMIMVLNVLRLGPASRKEIEMVTNLCRRKASVALAELRGMGAVEPRGIKSNTVWHCIIEDELL